MTVSYIVQLIGWYAIAVTLIALAVTAAGRYLDKHPSEVEQLAEDRLAHVNAWAAPRQDRTTQQLEDLWNRS